MNATGNRFVRWLRQLFGARDTLVETASPSALREGWFEALLEQTQFLKRYPQYAGVLARMDPIATNTVGVMAVGLARLDDPHSRVQLMVNRDWLDANPSHRTGVLLHEIQHVRLGHIESAKFHAVRYPRVMELAMEVSANESINDALPGNPLIIDDFTAHGIARGQSTMERYRLLADALERGDLHIEDWWESRMLDTHRPRQGGSRAAGLGDLLDARSDGATERNWNRAAPARGPRSSAREIERMKQQIAVHLRGERGGDDDPRRDGTQRRVAKELQRVVKELRHGGLDWRRVLRVAFPPRRTVWPDYLRPNRRFPQRVGEVPGRTRRPHKPTLLVGIDTSGSMTGETLDRVARELRRLAPHAHLTIAECDAAVHRVYPLTTRLGPFVGGGDTDFAPVFEEALGTRHFDGVIYFTDGKGNMPAVPPSLPVLWALTHDDPFIADWGAVVRIADRL